MSSLVNQTQLPATARKMIAHSSLGKWMGADKSANPWKKQKFEPICPLEQHSNPMLHSVIGVEGLR